MSATIEILKRARDLVAAGWTQRTMATDRCGDVICAFSQSATCFCALGAIQRATRDIGMGNFDPVECMRAVITSERSIGIAAIPKWNDNPDRTQSEVVAAFDKAIAAEESK